MKKNIFTFISIAITIVATAQTPRLSLFEEFTGETCPPCASTNPGLNALLAQPSNTPNVVAIKWQVPIPSAPTKTWSLYQTNKTEIDWRYATYGYGISSAPSGRMDGQNVTVFGAASDHPADLTSTIIATAQSYTSAFSVTMARAWNVGCTAVNLTVNIQATANFQSVGALVFRTVMVERLIQFSVQPGTNGEKDFEDVAIKSFPTLQGGIPMASTWTVGQTQTFTLSCPLPTYTRKKSQVAFVGFIQDDGTKKVAQAVRVGTAAVPTASMAAMGASVNITCNASINPTVTVRNDGPGALTTFTINPFTDNAMGTPVSWSGNLSVGAQTTMVLSSVQTPTSSGAHTFSYSIDIPSPQYNLNVTLNRADFFVASDYQGTPVVEGFTTSSFPPNKWATINKDFGPSWSRNTTTGGFNLSQECTKYDCYTNAVVGDVDELYLPPMDLTGPNPDPSITFDLAYAQRDATSSDKLEFYVSDNCGNTWTKMFDKSGSSLATFNDYVSNAYVPDPFDATHWRKVSVALTGFNKPQVLSKFVVTNDHGNNIYLDNVNLTTAVSSGLQNLASESVSFVVYPNPGNGETRIGFNAPQPQVVKIAVYNSLGQIVYSKQQMANTGNNDVAVDLKHLSNGIYIIALSSKHAQAISKITIVK